MERGRKKTTDPVARMCRSDESKIVRAFLSKVGEKWGIVLLVMLSRAPRQRARFSELQQMLDGISQRMLTTTLRDLERDGFVSREVFPEVPPRVEYELTDLGRSLLEPLEHLVRWIGSHWVSIERSRERFDARAR
ncbi:Transcriptional regulator, HxlR family protein [Minicystis rosea]|nr:Transcriptional regulator, HxlR family protein [Minicystis rosea]